MGTSSDWIELDERLLRDWALPEVPRQADKELRGQVLVVAGSREIPGAALLAATAALRAGAGKLVIATAASVANQLALAVPEARVIAMPESAQGAFRTDGLPLLEASARAADAALVGPGLMDEAGTIEFATALLPMLTHAPVVLDALAMNIVPRRGSFSHPVLLTPHAGEMAHLCGSDKPEIAADPGRTVRRAADRWNVMVALKGAMTFIAAPHAGGWRHGGGSPGLATSGSGDVLAGLIAGLAARGAPLEQACAWGVALHALAGARLARRLGSVGFLARELPGEIPALLESLRNGLPVSSPSRPPRQ